MTNPKDRGEDDALNGDSRVVETLRPVSKRPNPAWADAEWVTTETPIITPLEIREIEQEADIVAALFASLDDDLDRIQRVVAAVQAELEARKGRAREI
jgi:hypothetical protein